MIAMSFITHGAFVSMLTTLGELLDRGAEHAAKKSFDVDVLASARLAPDMFPLAKHVVIACDLAEEAVARLSGRELAKSAPGDERYAGVRARVTETLARLEKSAPAAIDGSEDRAITIPISPERRFEMTGLEYARDWALPQFHFHVAIAYSLLRHNGVELGMRDWGARVGAYMRVS